MLLNGRKTREKQTKTNPVTIHFNLQHCSSNFKFFFIQHCSSNLVFQPSSSHLVLEILGTAQFQSLGYGNPWYSAVPHIIIMEIMPFGPGNIKFIVPYVWKKYIKEQSKLFKSYFQSNIKIESLTTLDKVSFLAHQTIKCS